MSLSNKLLKNLKPKVSCYIKRNGGDIVSVYTSTDNSYRNSMLF